MNLHLSRQEIQALDWILYTHPKDSDQDLKDVRHIRKRLESAKRRSKAQDRSHWKRFKEARKWYREYKKKRRK